MRKAKRKYGCPVEFSIDLLSGKWKTVILSRLRGYCASAPFGLIMRL
jgi:DNA-binding HxlR family transcriptional regulator